MAEVLTARVRNLVSDVFSVPLAEISEATTHTDVENWDSANIINLILR